MHWSNAPALLLPPWTPMRLHWTFQCSCIEHSNAVALNIPMQLHCFCFSNKSFFLVFVLTHSLSLSLSLSPSLLSPPFTPTVHYNPQTSSLLQCNIQWLVYNDILCVITLLRETRTHDSGSWGSIAIHETSEPITPTCKLNVLIILLVWLVLVYR